MGGYVFVVVAVVGLVILGVGEVTVVHQVLYVLEHLDPAGHQRDAQEEGDELAVCAVHD